MAFSPGEHRVLAASATAIATTGDTSAHNIVTVTLGANTLLQHGCLKVLMAWSMTNSANSKTIAITWGGTSIMSFGVGTGVAAFQKEMCLFSRTTTSQVAVMQATVNGATSTSSASATTAVDQTIARDLVITITLANGGETATLEAYQIVVVNP